MPLLRYARSRVSGNPLSNGRSSITRSTSYNVMSTNNIAMSGGKNRGIASPAPCSTERSTKTWNPQCGIIFGQSDIRSPECPPNISKDILASPISNSARKGNGPTRSLSTPSEGVTYRGERNNAWRPTQKISFGSISEQPDAKFKSSTHVPDIGRARFECEDDDSTHLLPSRSHLHESASPIDLTPIETSTDSVIEFRNESNISSITVTESQHPPSLPLSYRASDQDKRDALLASQSSTAAYWRYSMYEGPAGEKVKVHYCRDFESSERIARLFLDGDVIGFDLEWKANVTASKGPRQNVSLIQVASEHRIALFHLALFEGGDRPQDLVPPTLRYIMETAKITKVGVAIKADCTRLRNFLDIDARGLFELSHLYKLVKYSTIDASQINKRLVSLAQQVQEHLQLPLWKGEVRYSDWSQPLDMQQIEYAASDPYACLHLFDALERKRSALNPCPPRPYHAELDMPIRLADGATIPTLDEDNYDDIPALDVDEENDTSSIDTVTSTLAAQHLSPASPPPSSSSPDSLVQFAQAFAEARRALPPRYSHPYPRATAATLRAYYLWHEHGLAPKEVAKRLRSPPLRETTVLTYIVEAIRLDDLDYDKVRLRQVMLALGDGARRVVRYKRLWAVVDK